MSNRAIYDSIVEEVKADIALIQPMEATTYEEAVANGTSVFLPSSLKSLNTPVSAFSDVDVRDGLIMKALEDESFAFVLIAKVANTVYSHQDNVTQDDLEALAVVANVSAMWAQTENALMTLKVLAEVVKDSGLVEPTLAGLTQRVLEIELPLDLVRKGAVAKLPEVEARLNTNSKEGE